MNLGSKHNAVGMGVELSQEGNYLLSESAARSQRSKTKETLLRLEDHLKRFPVIDKSSLPEPGIKLLSERVKLYKPVRIVIELSATLNQRLTESTYSSGLSKSKEAAFRVNAHLLAFSSIAKVSDVTARVIKNSDVNE